jgi:hypothetical protein
LLPTAASAQAREPRVFVGALAGSAFGAERGPVVAAQAGVRLGGLFVIGEVGRLQNVLPAAVQADLDIAAAILSLETGEDVELDGRLRATYAWAGVRWAGRGRRVTPFAEVAAGAAQLRLDVAASAEDREISEEFESGLQEQDFNATKPLIAAAAGLHIWIRPRLGFDAGYRYHRIFTGDPDTDAHAAFAAIKLHF